jgi:GNAT superfamily N-acetyltransferase
VLQLREVNDPRWTEDHISALRRWGADCYGLWLTDSDCAAQLGKIRAGNADLRVSEGVRVLEIHCSERGYCGDVTLTEGEDSHTEISILVFDHCSGGGIAKQALRQAVDLLRSSGQTSLEATVRLTNPNHDKLAHILESCGFAEYECTPPTVVYRFAV